MLGQNQKPVTEEEEEEEEEEEGEFVKCLPRGPER